MKLLPFLLVLQSHLILAPCIPILQVMAKNYIYDLYSFTPLNLNELAKSWNIDGMLDQVSTKTNLCGGLTILGGPLILTPSSFIEKFYTSLSPHSLLVYQMRFFVQGTWDVSAPVQILINDVLVFSFQPESLGAFLTVPILKDCNPVSAGQNFFYIAGKVIHSDSVLKFKVASPDSDVGTSYGFIDLKIRLAELKSSDVIESLIILNGDDLSGTPGFADCKSGKYYNLQLGACEDCDPLCAECFGPTAKECYGCKDRVSYMSDYDACVPCTSNCVICSGPKLNDCETCHPDYILYWNKTCQATGTCLCSACVYKNLFFKTCSTMCEQTNQFILPDLSCSDSCPSLLQQKMEGTAKVCGSPCTDNDYLFWDGTCKSVCPYHDSPRNGIKRCESCPSGRFLYANESCLPSCVKPYEQTIIGESGFCSICQGNPSIYYYEATQSCKALCNYPYKVINNVFCALDIQEDVKEQLNSMATGSHTVLFISSPLGSTLSLLTFSNPTAILVQTFQTLLGHTKYLKIGYPPKLKYFFSISIEPPFQIIPDIPESVTRDIPEYPLFETFEQDESLYSSFLSNFWGSVIALLILTVVIIILSVCSWCVSKPKLAVVCFKKLELAFKWNFAVSVFLSHVEEIVLFSSFELQTASPNTPLQILSFVLCFTLNLLILLTFWKMMSIVSLRWDIHPTNRVKSGYSESQVEKIQQYLQKYQSIFDEHKEKSILQQSFLIILILRSYIFVLVVAYLFEYPLVQISILVLMSIVMFLYLIIMRPLKGYVNLTQYILQELVMLTAESAILTLAVFDKLGLERAETRETLGNMVLNCQLALSGIQILYFFIQLLISVGDIYRALKRFYGKKEISRSSTLDILNGQPESGLQQKNESFSKFSEAKDISSESLVKTPSIPMDISQNAFQGESGNGRLKQERRKNPLAFKTVRRQAFSSRGIQED